MGTAATRVAPCRLATDGATAGPTPYVCNTGRQRSTLRRKTLDASGFPTEMRSAPTKMRLKWLQQSGALADAIATRTSIHDIMRNSNGRWRDQIPQFAAARQFRRFARKVHFVAW